MKSLYIASSHSFQEQMDKKWPSCDDEVDENMEGTYKERMIEYNYEQSLLRLIPCRLTDKWEEGVLYEEGRDYKVEPISVLKRLPVEIEGSDLTRKRIDHVIPITSRPIKINT